MGSEIATGDRRAVGEAEIARALRRLPAGWVTVNDLDWPGRPGVTIDHVVVGPGGVFVIAAESWTGTIEVRDEVLTQDGQSREQTVDLAARAAIAVQGIVPRRCFPVVCFAGAPLSGRAREVMICSSSTVRLKLLSCPHRLSPDDVRRCVEALETTSGHRAATSRAIRAHRKRREVRQPEMQRPVLAVVAMLELVLAIFLVLSGSLQQAGEWVTQGYVAVTDTSDPPDTKPSKHKNVGEQRGQDKQP